MADIFDLTLYNPHSEVLTVKEIYADQPFLGLVLPSGGQRVLPPPSLAPTLPV